ncbi:MAG TPA: class I SAM-dependent methyltransferase [Smithellaceae bacterium]|nr:class I SAM-dependent methyltransferase [Smithellaceae bacterium]
MGYFLNTTDDYHIHTLRSLGWELTVCNALYPENSPCRRALKSNAPFGEHLFNFLGRFIPLTDLKNILEVGGGLGYLMQDFLTLAPDLRATMLDISPFLLQKQKETLTGLAVNFREMDFLKMAISELRSFDFVILNENLGDFPTLAFQQNIPEQNDPETVRSLNRVADFENEYSLQFTPDENINIGALEAVEKLCMAAVPHIYLSEHSCETSGNHPSFPHLHFTAPGTPEKIALQGHTEFTIKFSYLQIIARAFNYEVFRGQYIDILPIDLNDKVQTALRSSAPLSDQQEILQHFIYDLYKYEYMIMTQDMKKKG